MAQTDRLFFSFFFPPLYNMYSKILLAGSGLFSKGILGFLFPYSERFKMQSFPSLGRNFIGLIIDILEYMHAVE
jgi:hypothetical protein